ncbi:MAG: outer membrane beta-barrel protein [Candidatus Omnitrophica bacterium]|nr:outer membrane beta-barrel protein [Candidatus Omnitrophota bacterium]
MKKLIVILVLLMPVLAFTQKQTSLKIKLGAGVPLGDYGSTEEEGNFAKTGFFSDFSVEHNFNKNVGIKTSLLSNSNKIDNDAILEYYEDPTAYYSMTSGAFSVNSLMFGLLLSIPMTGALIEFYGMPGLMIMKDPGMSIEGRSYQTADYAKISYDEAFAGGFCYKFGLDINFLVSKRVYLTPGISYYGTKAKFKDVPTKIILNSDYTTINIDYEYKPNILNIDFGIKILLGKLE